MHMWVARSRSKGGTRSHAGGKCSRTQGRQAPPPPASCACPQLAAPSTARRRTAGGLIGNAPVHSHSSRLGTNRQRPPPSAKRAPRWSAPHRVTSAAPPRRTPPHTPPTHIYTSCPPPHPTPPPTPHPPTHTQNSHPPPAAACWTRPRSWRSWASARPRPLPGWTSYRRRWRRRRTRSARQKTSSKQVGCPGLVGGAAEPTCIAVYM